MSRLDDAELLVRFVEGELTVAEAAAVRARVAAEPDLAALLDEVRGIGAAVGRLPLPPPPPELDARVLDAPAAGSRSPLPSDPPRRGPAPARSQPVRWLLAGALAAGTLVGLWPEQRGRVSIVAGVDELEGRLDVNAGGQAVRLDGGLRVEVTPGVEAPRVVLRLLHGAGQVRGEGGAWTDLAVGVEHATGPAPASAPAASGSDGPGPASDLEHLKLELAMARARLVWLQGLPEPWPEGLPATYQEPGFRAASAGIAQQVEGAELLRVECDEFPCVGFFALPEGPGPFEALSAAVKGVYGETANILLWGDRKDEGGGWSYAAVAVTPDEGMGGSLRTRLHSRVQPVLEELRHAEDEAAAP